jgi:hypothetical protein
MGDDATFRLSVMGDDATFRLTDFKMPRYRGGWRRAAS